MIRATKIRIILDMTHEKTYPEKLANLSDVICSDGYSSKSDNNRFHGK